CDALSGSLPPMVHFLGSVEYERQQHEYFILQQTDIRPSCRVIPATPSDISLIMETVTFMYFSVRSGGYLSWPGSNVN
ncbi:hypothetical protein K435DRAFT_614652, partial [Dendrothele bispora CBS 962.96]